MSHAARCLRSLNAAGKLARRIPATKRHMHAQAELKERPIQHSASTPSSSFDSSDQVEPHFESNRQPASTKSQRKSSPTPGAMAWHLNQLFSPLEFSEDLAHRLLTHSSHPEARDGHNGQLSFIGRRTLETYLLLFLNSSSSLNRNHDLEHIIAQTIASPVLGQHIGSNWGLGQVIKWSPAVPRGMLGKQKHLIGAGLWKVQGEAVSAVLGGVYWQYGASTAHKLFHTRMLPHLLLEGGRTSPGLPSEFHEDARKVCAKLGGPDARLISRERKKEIIERVKEKVQVAEGKQV